jgi:hypothetical protein
MIKANGGNPRALACCRRFNLYANHFYTLIPYTINAVANRQRPFACV